MCPCTAVGRRVFPRRRRPVVLRWHASSSSVLTRLRKREGGKRRLARFLMKAKLASGGAQESKFTPWWKHCVCVLANAPFVHSLMCVKRLTLHGEMQF